MMNLLFIEATRFIERIQQLRAELSLGKLEDLLCENPESGAVISLKQVAHAIHEEVKKDPSIN